MIMVALIVARREFLDNGRAPFRLRFRGAEAEARE